MKFRLFPEPRREGSSIIQETGLVAGGQTEGAARHAQDSEVVPFTAKPQDGTEVLLKNVEAFRRRERQRPANQRQVHTIFAVGRLRPGFVARAGIRLGLVATVLVPKE